MMYVCDTLGKAKYSGAMGDYGGERLREFDAMRWMKKTDCEFRSRWFAHAKVLWRSESVGRSPARNGLHSIVLHRR